MSTLPFSLVRRVGSLVFLSGELGFGPDGKIAGDIATQTRLTFENIEETLKGEGLDRRAIVSCVCHLVNKSDFDGFNAAYKAFFGDGPLPVRTTVLANLVLDALIEITVIAQDARA